MVNIVVVSHIRALAHGVKSLADSLLQCGELTTNRAVCVRIAAVGGIVGTDGQVAMGTSAEAILQAICGAWSDEGVLILFDIGSALLSTETALELLPDERRTRCRIADAPLVEGTIAAAMEASFGCDLDAVCAAAEAARQMQKL